MNKKQAIVAIGDIHGHQYEHVSLLRQIRQQYDIIQLIYLGDLIDRGPHSDWVLRDVRDKITKGYNITMLRGNHENELIKWFNTRDKSFLNNCLKNGGKETMKSLTGKKYDTEGLLKALEEYMLIFNAMKYYHVQIIAGKTFVFSHSGGDRDTIYKILDDEKLTEGDLEALMYSRQRYMHRGIKDCDNVFCVYGHTPVHYASENDGMEPLVMWNDSHTSADIDIDTGCYTGKALSALVIDAETGEFETVSFPYTKPPVNKDSGSDEYEKYFDWHFNECMKEAGEEFKTKKKQRESAQQSFVRRLLEDAEEGEGERGKRKDEK